MTTITLPPEIETLLAEEAQRQGTTTELLTLDKLRALVSPETASGTLKNSDHEETLYDFLQGYVGTVDGSTEALSENCGGRFAEDMVKKHHEGKL